MISLVYGYQNNLKKSMKHVIEKISRIKNLHSLLVQDYIIKKIKINNRY